MPRRSSNNRLTPVSSKASEPMNRLIVKPMPQRAAVPYKEPQDMPAGSLVNLSLIATQQIPKIPTCFPINKPSAMPSGIL